MPYANNKATDQPVHPRSLINVFIGCCLDTCRFYVQNLKTLPSRQVWVLFSRNPYQRKIFLWRGSDEMKHFCLWTDLKNKLVLIAEVTNLILQVIIPHHFLCGWVLCYTLWTLSVHPSVHQSSVRANILGLGASLSMIMRFIPLRIHWVAIKPIFCLRFRGYFSMGV